MAMRNGVRTAWLAAGGVLSVSAVLAMALAVWADIRLPHDYDFTFPGSYDSSLLDRRTSETTTTVYSLAAPRIIVDATGHVGVRVVPGTAGRLSVRREITWALESRGIEETWENGRTLRIRLSCPRDGRSAGGACAADYTLSVPPDVKVVMATLSGVVPCPRTAAETICRSPSAGDAE